MNDWFNYSVIVVEPLFDEARRLLLQQRILLGDDARVRLLTRGALEEEVEKMNRRRGAGSRDRPPPGSVNSYVWLYTGLDGV